MECILISVIEWLFIWTYNFTGFIVKACNLCSVFKLLNKVMLEGLDFEASKSGLNWSQTQLKQNRSNWNDFLKHAVKLHQ